MFDEVSTDRLVMTARSLRREIDRLGGEADLMPPSEARDAADARIDALREYRSKLDDEILRRTPDEAV